MKNWFVVACLSLGLVACKTSQVNNKREIASIPPGVATALAKVTESTGQSEDTVLLEMSRLLQNKGVIRRDADLSAIRSIEDLKARLLKSEEEALAVLRQNADYFASRLKVSTDIVATSLDNAAEASGMHGAVSVPKNAFKTEGDNWGSLAGKSSDNVAEEMVTATNKVKNTNREIANVLGGKEPMGPGCENLSVEAVENADGIAQSAFKRLKSDADYGNITPQERGKRFEKYRMEEYEAKTGQPKRNICHAFSRVPKGEKVAGVNPACPTKVYNEIDFATVSITCD